MAERRISGPMDILKHYETHAPLKRNVLPEELGATGLFLASDGARRPQLPGRFIYVDSATR